VSLRLHASRVSLLPGALECVRGGHVPGGLKANRQFTEGCLEIDGSISPDVMTLLYDPQTAGGLLISVAENDVARLTAELSNAGVDASEIGEVITKHKPLIAVLP